VEYSYCIGPSIFSFANDKGKIFIRLLPFGETAKLPTVLDDNMTETCTVSLGKQAIINISCGTTLILNAVVSCLLADNPVGTVTSNIVREWVSGIGIGKGQFTIGQLSSVSFRDVFAYCSVLFALVNVIPIMGNPMGGLMCCIFPKLTKYTILYWMSLIMVVIIFAVSIMCILW
jgi:hypothetical protein